MPIYEGRLTPLPDTRYAIVAGRFNHRVTERLVQGAEDTLRRHGTPPDHIDIVWVPGAFEIPGTVQHLLTKNRYDGIITLGAIVRGETPHFDYVSGQVSGGIGALSRTSPVPVIFGILTCDTMQQAEDRADGKAGNKGADAALALLEMAHLYRQLDADDTSPTGST